MDSNASTRQQTPHLNKTTTTAAIIDTNENDSSRAKIEALAEMICAGGDESAAALLVLMGKFQHAADPQALAHTVKHFAFTRCGELNVNGMVEAQIEIAEIELFGADTHVS